MPYPVNSSDYDVNGLQLMLSDDVQAAAGVSLTGSTFFNPDTGYTGYAADGNYYVAGVADTSVARASWATEAAGDHRGPHNRFPEKSLMLLTTKDLTVIDALDYTVFLRVVALEYPTLSGTEVPGIFLEWEQDASLPSLGSTLGIYGSDFNAIKFVNGVLVISTSNGTRVLNFREDQAYCLTSVGYFSARYVSRSGLEYRNLPDYFGDTANAALTGPDTSLAVDGRAIGGYTFFAVGSATGVTVLRWSGPTMGSLSVEDTLLGGITRGVRILSSGELYLLVVYDDGGSDRLKAVRSATEWQTVSGSFSAGTAQRSIPSWPGGVGFMDLAGDYLYIGVGSGIWRMSRDLDDPAELAYGKTLTAAEPTPPLWEILPQNNSPISALVTDITTGFLGVLAGNILAIVDPGNHVVSGTYSTTTDPELPASPASLVSFYFDIAEVA